MFRNTTVLNGLCNRVEGRSVSLSVINSNPTSGKREKKEKREKKRSWVFSYDEYR